MNDLIRTQHYSTNILLLDGLLNFIPENAKIIEPFYGKGDLVKNIDISEYYDISLEDNHKRDTLLNPPDYKGKWVITNPPYLAKNKAKNKKYFSDNDYDDLYKMAISTMLAAEGGILTEEEQKKIIKEANKVLGQIREQYFDIILTNFRDRNRKRISFQEAYQIVSFSYWLLKRNKGKDFIYEEKRK